MESGPANNSIARLSHTHEQIINWLIANPELSLRQCADYFGYTQSWLSRLIHSDLFQNKLRDRQDAVFISVAQDIPAKLRSLADISIERVCELVATTESPDVLVDVFDKTLHRLGYAPSSTRNPGPAPVQNNVFVVSSADLASAREVVVSGAPIENTSPQPALGEVQSFATPGHEAISAPRQETPRGEV